MDDLLEFIYAEQMRPILSELGIETPECAICRKVFKGWDRVIKIESAVGQNGGKCECKYGYDRECIENWRIHSDTVSALSSEYI